MGKIRLVLFAFTKSFKIQIQVSWYLFAPVGVGGTGHVTFPHVAPPSSDLEMFWSSFAFLSLVFFLSSEYFFWFLEKTFLHFCCSKPTALEQSQAQHNRHMCQPSPKWWVGLKMERVVFSPLKRQKRWRNENWKRSKRFNFRLCKGKTKDKRWKRLSFDLCKGKKDPRICLNHSGNPGTILYRL